MWKWESPSALIQRLKTGEPCALQSLQASILAAH